MEDDRNMRLAWEYRDLDKSHVRPHAPHRLVLTLALWATALAILTIAVAIIR